MDIDKIRTEYRTLLSELTFNCKPLITTLTQKADAYVAHARIIVSAIEDHIRNAQPAQKIPSIYLLDSILKNLQAHTPYPLLFANNIYKTFTTAYNAVNVEDKNRMERLLETWKKNPLTREGNPLFDNKILHGLAAFISSNRPSIPKTYTAIQQPKASYPQQPRAPQQQWQQQHTYTQALPQPVIALNGVNALLDQQIQSLLSQKEVSLMSGDFSASTQIPVLRELLAVVKSTPLDTIQALQITTQLAQMQQTPSTNIIPQQPMYPTSQSIMPLYPSPPDQQQYHHLLPSSLPPSIPPLPNVTNSQLDTAGLMDSLMKSGLLDTLKNKTASPILTTSSLPGSKSPPLKNFRILHVKLSSDDIKVKRPINQVLLPIYDDLSHQCSQCGYRFSPANERVYSAHLDWHFRNNKRLNKVGGVVGTSRDWYLSTDDWIKGGDGVKDRVEFAPTFKDESKLDHEEKLKQQHKEDSDEETLNTPLQNLPVDGVSADVQACSICQEDFEKYWEEDEEEWMYLNIIKVEGDNASKYCHHSCLLDSQKKKKKLKRSTPDVLNEDDDDWESKKIKIEAEVKKEL